ncbi:MAG: NPCBM/NEW2 domain-containing protein, partial [Clostridia bacterium]|nr:NPCBM/NEW2 domain-containing protein [Clostridia bacterium]
PSYVAFDISAYSNEYKYFSAFGGLLSSATKSDGALMYVQTSADGSNWTTAAVSDTSVPTDSQGRQLVNYSQNFLYFTLDVTGVKWIRLVADKNKSDAQDYVIWADAKLSKTLDDGASVKPLAEYDRQIKEFGANANLNNPDFELLVLQREFVSRVGQYALKRFIGESEDNDTMLDWLLNDLDNLREFMLGGTPFKGNYYNSLNVLSKLYKNYKKDLADKTLLGYNHTGNKWMPNRTFGELCRTIMFSVALTHDGTIASYLQPEKKQNQSDPLRRYAIFKYMYQTERFVATRNTNGTWKSETMSWFETYRVEEMRWLMCNIIDDESILWLNDYVQTRINASPNNVGNLYTPHSYVKYITPNYNNPVFYATENHEYFNSHFAVDYKGDNAGENWAGGNSRVGMFDTKYTVPAGEGQDPYVITISYSKQGEAKLQKVWMNFTNKFGTGSVCGGISKSGTNIRTSRGIPANVIGQPGHAAILYYGKDANGNGSWKIDNDVGGWLAATKGERHLLGWGSASWQRNSGGTVVYFHLAQTCLNDYDN